MGRAARRNAAIRGIDPKAGAATRALATLNHHPDPAAAVHQGRLDPETKIVGIDRPASYWHTLPGRRLIATDAP